MEPMLFRLLPGPPRAVLGSKTADSINPCAKWTHLLAKIGVEILRLRVGKLIRAIRMVAMTSVLASLQLLVKCLVASRVPRAA